MTPYLSTAPAAKTNALRGNLMARYIGANKSPPPLSATLCGLLLNTAVLAVAKGMDAEALVLRQVLIGLGVERKKLGMAMALTKLQQGEYEACLVLLELEVLAQEPGHELALAVQSHVWQLQGLAKGHAQANTLLVSSADPAVRAIVRAFV